MGFYLTYVTLLATAGGHRGTLNVNTCNQATTVALVVPHRPIAN